MTPFGKILQPIIEGINVTDLSIDGTPLTMVNYMYEHPLKVVERLNLMAKDPVAKYNLYPLVAVLVDINEKVHRDVVVPKFTVLIAARTDPSYHSFQRDELVFEPILIPIYDKVIQALKYSNNIALADKSHDRIQRYYWGSDGINGGSNILDDHVDAIELTFYDTRLINNC